ncbi:hypothetical protein TNCV_3555711 [Trichonephila clavipes]|nr:hypothetical protein TNCV_3555711 [Trichonephila clavipes]
MWKRKTCKSRRECHRSASPKQVPKPLFRRYARLARYVPPSGKRKQFRDANGGVEHRREDGQRRHPLPEGRVGHRTPTPTCWSLEQEHREGSIVSAR